jgi:fructose-1,6-bisphosphatase II
MPEMMERNLALELVRVTEAAALSAVRWMGRGDKIAADGAAVGAMRQALARIDMDGVVVIGEGEKDEAPMLFIGEQIGNGRPPQVDIAVDPVDGTRLLSLGMPGAIAVVALAERGTMYNTPPGIFYMEKIVVGPQARGVIDIRASVADNIAAVSSALGRDKGNITVMVLDRPRHEQLIREIRDTGARVSLIPDGDVMGAITAAEEGTGVDMLMGTGGAPEAVGGGVRAQGYARRYAVQALLPKRRRASRHPGGGYRYRRGLHDRRPGEERRRLFLGDGYY